MPAATLDKLEVTYEHTNMLFSVRGNVVRLSTSCDSNQELTELVESMYYVLPLMLTLEFGESVVVDRVSGTVG